MAVVTWVGGTHRITDPGVWNPAAPGPGDTGEVDSGHIVVFDKMAGPYAINLIGFAGPATLDLFEATITGPISNITLNDQGFEECGSGSINLVGADINTSQILALGTSFGSTTQIALNLADLTAPDGHVIQQAVLINTGDIESGVRNYSLTTIESGSSDAGIVNNGNIGGFSPFTINLPMLGIGTIIGAILPTYDLTITKAVSAQQTVNVTEGTLHLTDPIDFRATIAGPVGYKCAATIQLDFTATAARFVGHVLTLFEGSTIGAEPRFDNDVAVADLAIVTLPDRTEIVSPNSPFGPEFNPIPSFTIQTTGTTPMLAAPVLPSPVVKLPGSGPDVTVTSGAKVASVETLNGYTVRLESASASSLATLDETSTTFGRGFTLRVDGRGAAARFGSLGAVGYNENDGTIAATTGSGAAMLGIGITDVSSTAATILTGAFNNKGVINAGAGSTIDITGSAGSKLINAGSVVANGMVFIAPTVTGTGTMTVGDHTGTAGSLELGGLCGYRAGHQPASRTADHRRRQALLRHGIRLRRAGHRPSKRVGRGQHDLQQRCTAAGRRGGRHPAPPPPERCDVQQRQLPASHSGGDTIIITTVQT